jgi:protein AroM
MTHFGLVTIGQAPRDDVLRSMLPPAYHRRILQRGALDDLPRHAIDQLRPRDGEVPLVTRLSDGEEVVVCKHRLMSHLQRAVDLLVADGATACAILCTGSFPELRSPIPIIFPDRVLLANVEALLPSGTLGVIMPHGGQMDMMRKKWQTLGRNFVGVAASPYAGHEDLASLGRQLEGDAADLIVMDCMGFTEDMKRSISRATSIPVILANRLVGRIIEELIGDVSDHAATTPSVARTRHH